MADLVLVSVVLAFTALCVAYIAWCDRIIGPDDFVQEAAALDGDSATDELVAAGNRSVAS